jgi:hypothetical protein
MIMTATTLDPRLEKLFSLRNLTIRRGDETPEFEGIMVIKGRDVAVAKNRGTGGANTYLWMAPFTHQWAEEKLLPLAVKIASAKEPEYKDLYSRSPSTALDSLVFDYIENERVERSLSRRRGPFRPEDADGEGVAGSPAPSRTAHLFPNTPTTSGLRVGAKVEFGRENGEKTTGIIKKLNRKTALVETIEARGRHPVGTKFRVAPALLTVLP